MSRGRREPHRLLAALWGLLAAGQRLPLQCRSRQPRWSWLRLRGLLFAGLLASLLLLCLALPSLTTWLPLRAAPATTGTPAQPLPQSSEALALQSPWSRPASYPLDRRPPADLYLPSAAWIGRLILPTLQELADREAPAGDWVWIELEQAPAQAEALIGRRSRLTWAEDPQLGRLVQAVTTDIRLGAEARRASARGDVVPSRLDGRRQVGPLQSLAGARPVDDMTVQLESVQLEQPQLEGVAREAVSLQAIRPQAVLLRIARPPVQISGRWQALVRFEGRAKDGDPLEMPDPVAAVGAAQGSVVAPSALVSGPVPVSSAPASGPAQLPSSSSALASGSQTGGEATSGRAAALSSRPAAAPSALASAPAVAPSSGVGVLPASHPQDFWWVRHYNRRSGRFDGPREIIRLPLLPRDRFGRLLFDPTGLERSEPNRQGWWIQGAPGPDGVFTVQALEPRALLTPRPEQQIKGTVASLSKLLRGSWSPPQLIRGTLHSTALLPDGVPSLDWKPGQRALLMHLFGGIGGPGGEPVSGWTVTGHFAFGEARVVEDPFSGQPRLQIRYHQIYANNPNGIVAGSQDWSAYGGNLQRGWLGTRPFSDALIPLGPRVLDAIAVQAELLAARYRSGDGHGVALVTPATSCVQDSAQALWIALRQLQQPGHASQPPSAVQLSAEQPSAEKPAAEGSLAAESSAETERLRRLGLALDHLLT